MWNVATGQQIGPSFTSSSGSMNSVVFSPDGETLATAGDDGNARLWDIATGRQIGPSLTSNSGAVNSVAFSPDGKTLVTASLDGGARLWNVAYLVDVAQQLCSQVGNAFTPAMWAQYVPAGPAYRKVCS